MPTLFLIAFMLCMNYSKAIGNQGRIEYRKANRVDKELMKGTHYLLLTNTDKLNHTQTENLKKLLDGNVNLNSRTSNRQRLLILLADIAAMAHQKSDFSQ